ncbi:hypothetical protein ABNM12_09715 [Pseudomonas syringae]|uniref:hypothetical protein n=1 Tax=Pseudomonas syringae TaxID=317 RepID=UPI0009B49BB4|nr:hypothetical protein [Pseudomonas syringae]MCH5512554.1 hypothetical protein [Pseudomonas syringae pv. syringae]MCH5552991.1 hypothetical protein [Pseudomonas syringae pv. syringae]MCH5577098.1 hypothetical protein [Pseudomonas syringae pv. syringae]MCH5625928.1 hypothetical protein [Pseudomonas syringae pv. syringae]MCH5665372.1 hypothetical protein [Pseudomonas syringae pv. syringae]
MALDLPAPKVPDLQQPGNYLDLDQLGGADLTTWIDYPGIKNGDRFMPNWRGCGALGAVEDYVGDVIEVVGLQPEGMPLLINNPLLMRLDKGWVFYSYIVEGRPDESLRLFFYVGKPPSTAAGLGVLQCKESHDLKLDPDLLWQISEVLFVAPPYQAMRVGDRVTLTLDLYFDESTFWYSLVRSRELTVKEVGQPLQWPIGSNELAPIRDGFALMSYRIEYADSTLTTVSATQSLAFVAPSTALLPALTIKDFNGGSLDPEAFPDGVTLLVDPFGMQIDDDVVVYVSSGNRLVQTLRADLSNLDSGVLQFSLAQAWLSANNGKEIELVYQYARPGNAASSLPRKVILSRPLDLPAPVIGDAIIDGSGEGTVTGYIFASQLQSGVTIRIPKEAFIGDDYTVQMHWEGYTSTGSFIADPSPGDPRLFVIPPTAVPANMGKWVAVYYKVVSASQSGTSQVFNLEVRALGSVWPYIQIMRPRVTDALLDLARVPPEGAGLDLESWAYMAPRQRVRIKATGLLPSGLEQTVGLRTGAAEPVSEAEHQARQLSVIIPRGFLESLQRNRPTNTVTVEVSFDEGANYTQFPSIDFTVLDDVFSRAGGLAQDATVTGMTPHLHGRNPMATNTLNNLTEWMKDPANNVMWGWDSIAAMARGKVNNLLLQEYIARFSSNAYLQPVSGEVALSDGFKENIHNFILDAPRLAFTNDNLGQSHATLTCSVLGGTQLTMKNNVDNWEAYRIIHIDALQGPKLTLDLALERVPGDVQSDGRVRLDLKDSDNFILTFAVDRADRALGGDFFKALFSALPDEQRVWTLGVIKHGSNNLMHPQSFKLRTQTNPAAPLDPQAANYGDGAVLVFIRLAGSQEGGDIPVEYQYLIPDDAGKDYSATVLFSAERTFKAALFIGEVTKTIASIIENGVFNSVHDGSGRLIKATATSGRLTTSEASSQDVKVDINGVAVFANVYKAGTWLDVSGSTPLSVELIGDGTVALTWKSKATPSVVLTLPGHGTLLVMSKVVTVDVRCIYTFAEENNDLVLIPGLTINTTIDDLTSVENPPPANSFSLLLLITSVKSNFEKLNKDPFESDIKAVLARKLATRVPISAFIRDSIDLNFNEAIVPDVLRAPRDIAAFGRINSSGADFVVSPAEHLMVVDSSTTFSIQPPGANVTWSVERLQGDAQNFGAVNGTGRYYAPESSLTELAFTRVRVTATDLKSNDRSSALVTIVTNPITLNPLIQVCDAGQTVELQAGSLGTEEMDWSLKDPVAGESGVLEPSALADGDHRYVAAPKVTGKTYVLDQIVVTSQQASVSSWVLVKHQVPLLTVKVVKTVEVSEVLDVEKVGEHVDVVNIRADQVQLQAFANGLTPPGVKWRVGAGRGRIDDGLYTPDVASTDRFVLIFAEAPNAILGVIEGHIVLPLPLDRFATDLELMKGKKAQAF